MKAFFLGLKERANTFFLRSFATMLALTICALGAFTWIAANRVSPIMESMDAGYTVRIVQLVSEKLETYLKSLEQLTLVPYQDEGQQKIKTLLSISETNSLAYYNAKKEFFRACDDWYSFLNLSKYVTRLLLFQEDKLIERSISPESYPDETRLDSLVARAMQEGGAPIYQITHQRPYSVYYETDTSPYLAIARRINLSPAGENVVLMLVVDFSYIQTIIESTLAQDDAIQFFIQDEAGDIAFALNPGTEEILEQLQAQRGRKEYLYNSYAFTHTGWNFITLSPTSQIQEMENTLWQSLLIALLIVSIAVLVLAAFLTSSMVKPVKRLASHSQSIQEGHFDTALTLKGPREIRQMAETLNQMLQNLTTSIEQNYALSIREKEARFSSLQAQINPHFLYNTLNSISMAATLHDLPEIAANAQALSDMFRYNIRNTNSDVMLRDEINHVGNYLSIQNWRHDNRIDFTLDIPEELMEVRMVKFILQPIVENAIYHGLEPWEGEWRITISAWWAEKGVLVAVRDTGIGMSAEQLDRLRAKMEDGEIVSPDPHASGIGLINVHQRLRLCYGADSGLTVESLPGQGTTVWIALPGEHPKIVQRTTEYR